MFKIYEDDSNRYVNTDATIHPVSFAVIHNNDIKCIYINMGEIDNREKYEFLVVNSTGRYYIQRINAYRRYKELVESDDKVMYVDVKSLDVTYLPVNNSAYIHVDVDKVQDVLQ